MAEELCLGAGALVGEGAVGLGAGVAGELLGAQAGLALAVHVGVGVDDALVGVGLGLGEVGGRQGVGAGLGMAAEGVQALGEAGVLDGVGQALGVEVAGEGVVAGALGVEWVRGPAEQKVGSSGQLK